MSESSISRRCQLQSERNRECDKKKRQKRDESLWKRLQSLRCADSDLLQTPSLAAACRLSTKIQLEKKAEPEAELPLASSQATNLTRKFTHLMSPIQKTPRSGMKTSLEWSQLFDCANPATLPVQKKQSLSPHLHDNLKSMHCCVVKFGWQYFNAHDFVSMK